jgi:hypothetical protein
VDSLIEMEDVLKLLDQTSMINWLPRVACAATSPQMLMEGRECDPYSREGWPRAGYQITMYRMSERSESWEPLFAEWEKIPLMK